MIEKYNYDTHLHLDLYKDREETIRYIEDSQSYTIAVTNLPVLYEKYQEKYKGLKYIRFAMGLHPQLLPEYKEQLLLMLKNIKRCRYVGEIGLDFMNADSEIQKMQMDVLAQIIKECNSVGNKVLSVHSRRATKQVMEIIGNRFNGKVILHWFTGNLTEMNQAIKNGYYFSINSQMIKTQKGIKLIEYIPLDRILIESDGPFTKIVAQEYDVRCIDEVQQCVAEVKKISLEDIRKKLFNNFREILS